MICDYDISTWPTKPAERCGQPALYICLVEDIGAEGSQSKTERRCERHAKMADVIERWSEEEWNNH